jgi:uncharacterized protein YjiS (DUF1127 family)
MSSIKNIRWNNQCDSTMFPSSEIITDIAAAGPKHARQPTGKVYPAQEADMTTRTISLGKTSSFSTIANRLIVKTWKLWRAWMARRQVMGLLEADDHMLRDIGLTRADVIGSLEARMDADPSRHLVRARAERMSDRARRQRSP